MRRRDLLVVPVAAAGIALGALVLIRVNPLGLLHSCPLRLVTGIPCPACGGTASIRALLGGNLGAALAANPLVFLVAVLLCLAALAAPVAIPWASRIDHIPRPRRTLVVGATVVLVAANWIYLLIHLR